MFWRLVQVMVSGMALDAGLGQMTLAEKPFKEPASARTTTGLAWLPLPLTP